jgi:FimV-like protein
MLNYLDLAKAYIQDDKPPKAIEVLKQLVKLPLRTADDAALKEEGKKLLSDLQ